MNVNEAFKRILLLAAKDIDSREAIDDGEGKELDRDGEAWRVVHEIAVIIHGMKALNQ